MSSRNKRIGLLLAGLAGLLVMVAMATGFFDGFGTPAAASGEEALQASTSERAEHDSAPPGSRLASLEEPDAGEDSSSDEGVPVRVLKSRIGSVSSYISATANLVAENEVKVLAESEGRIVTLKVEEGDQVQAGQILATLMRDEAEIAVKKTELRAANARNAYERALQLVAEELVSQEEFDRLGLERDVADQELEEARWRLKKKTVRAPFNGRITLRNTRVGQHVKPGDDLFTVTDFDPLIARVYLPEKDVFGLQEGRDVRISLKANEDVSFFGRIRQISPVVDTATGTVKLTIEASEPPAQVRPGSFVAIGIVREHHPTAIVVPRDAVIRELQEAYVFVVAGGVAERRSVILGLEEGRRIEVVSGVSEGERVVVSGHGGLKDGTSIRVVSPSKAGAEREPDPQPIRG